MERSSGWLFLAVACSSSSSGPPPEPPLTITSGVNRLTARFDGQVYNGCEVSWRATANDDTTLIRYSINTGNSYPPTYQPEPPITGTFQDSVRVQFVIDSGSVFVDPHTIDWDFVRVRGDSILGGSLLRIRQDVVDPYCWIASSVP